MDRSWPPAVFMHNEYVPFHSCLLHLNRPATVEEFSHMSPYESRRLLHVCDDVLPILKDLVNYYAADAVWQGYGCKLTCITLHEEDAVEGGQDAHATEPDEVEPHGKACVDVYLFEKTDKDAGNGPAAVFTARACAEWGDVRFEACVPLSAVVKFEFAEWVRTRVCRFGRGEALDANEGWKPVPAPPILCAWTVCAGGWMPCVCRCSSTSQGQHALVHPAECDRADGRLCGCGC